MAEGRKWEAHSLSLSKGGEGKGGRRGKGCPAVSGELPPTAVQPLVSSQAPRVPHPQNSRESPAQPRWPTGCGFRSFCSGHLCSFGTQPASMLKPPGGWRPGPAGQEGSGLQLRDMRVLWWGIEIPPEFALVPSKQWWKVMESICYYIKTGGNFLSLE